MFAMNIATLPFVKVGGTNVFGSDGLFNSRLVITSFKSYLPRGVNILANSSDAFVRYVTYPWGVSSIADGNLPTFSAPSPAPAMPAPYVDPITYPLDVQNDGYTGVNAFTVEYQDTSNIFAVAASAITSDAIKFRCITKGYKEVYSIRFLTDVFSMTNTRVIAPTKWLDNSLDVSSYRFVFFEKIVALDTASKASIEVTGTQGSTKPSEIYLYVPTAVTLDNYYLVIQGAGTVGGVRENGSTTILSWDSDLTFATGAATVVGTQNRYTLTPVRLTGTGEDGSYQASPSLPWANSPVNVTIFGFAKASIAGRQAGGVSGFTNPSDVVTVKKAGLSAVFSAGDYVTFSFATADFNTIDKRIPPLKGCYQVVTVTPGAPDAMTIRVQPSYETYSQLTGTSVTVSNKSYVIDTKKVIFFDASGNLRIALRNKVIPLRNSLFLMIRGIDPASTSLKYSGWYTVAGSWGNVTYGGVTLEVLTPLPAGSVDYSKITAIDFSATLSANTTSLSGGTYIPIPVPLSSEVSPNLKDLARPVFTSDFISPISMLIQVTKRIAAAVALQRGYPVSYKLPYFGYGLYGDTTSLNIPSEENSAILVDTLPLVGNRNICPAFPQTGYDLDAEKSGVYTAYGLLDNVDGTQSTNSVTLTAGNTTTIYPTVLDLPNFIQWTTTVASNVQDAAVFPMFKRGYTFDLGSQDDAEITAAAPFRDMLLVFKRNSIWRVGVDNAGAITAQRLQATVGTLAMKNVVAYDDGVYFLHESGMHVTDGNTVISVFALSRPFDKFVTRSPSLFARCAGYADTEAKFAAIGIPYNSEFSSPVEAVDGQFVFSYNDQVLGWGVNNQIDAVAFARVNNQTFFGSTRGRVYRMRTEDGLTQYRDGSEPIPFMLQTRYLPALGQPGGSGDSIETSDQITKFKFLRNVLFQFGADTDYNMQTYYSLDYKTLRVPLELFTIRGTQTINGQKVLGNDRFVKALRETLGVRAAQISFTLFDNTLDSDGAIYSISVEGWVTNTRLVPQQATRSGAR
jgi:hypothetical protein